MILRLTLVLITSILSGCAGSTGAAPDERSTEGAVDSAASTSGAKLPDFTLKTVDGGEFTLSDHVGRSVIVMSFWATWCTPCLEELPHLEVLYQQEKGNGLMIVALSMDEPSTLAEVVPTTRRLGLTMPVALDTEQRAVRFYNRSRSAPMTVIIDRGGRIVRSTASYNAGDERVLAREVRALLASR